MPRYSNGVRIPGEATLPAALSQPEVTCMGQAGAHDDERVFPWWSPGSAPVFGSCGTMGGWPAGCHGDYSGHFGDCCSGNCDGFALGLNAEEYEWPHQVTTTCNLYCAALCFAVLYCIILYCTVLYCTVLYCTVLDYIVLYCNVMYTGKIPD